MWRLAASPCDVKVGVTSDSEKSSSDNEPNESGPRHHVHHFRPYLEPEEEVIKLHAAATLNSSRGLSVLNIIIREKSASSFFLGASAGLCDHVETSLLAPSVRCPQMF